SGSPRCRAVLQVRDMTQPRMLGGRYELDGIVGRGGMAEVFRARDIRLDRIVAVKTLRDDLARDQTFQARFRREAQSAASLNHPSIVAVYDTGEDMMGPTPVPYIVMEYVDGRTLRDLLRDDRRLLPERALEITDGVLRALDYSHRNGIVHRDIKPGNVMLTRNGEVKVMDFGIARAVSDTQATMTQTAQVIGTAQYLSPEQARGERVDARSDLYSAGCLLYELLTGRPPVTAHPAVAGRPRAARLGGLDRTEGDGQGPRSPVSVGGRDAQRPPAGAVGGTGVGPDAVRLRRNPLDRFFGPAGRFYQRDSRVLLWPAGRRRTRPSRSAVLAVGGGHPLRSAAAGRRNLRLSLHRRNRQQYRRAGRGWPEQERRREDDPPAAPAGRQGQRGRQLNGEQRGRDQHQPAERAAGCQEHCRESRRLGGPGQGRCAVCDR